jgi:hypothetical protein
MVMADVYALPTGCDSRKMAENCGSLQVRTLRSRAFGIDNGSRERDALAAFRLTSKCPIGLTGAARPTARRLTHVVFPNGIADAHDHV